MNPALGEVREPVTHCLECGRELKDTCRHCWRCSFRLSMEARQDAGPSRVEPDDND